MDGVLSLSSVSHTGCLESAVRLTVRYVREGGRKEGGREVREMVGEGGKGGREGEERVGRR